MKKLLIVLVSLVLFSTACYSATVTFEWDLSTDDASLGAGGGYRLYQSKVSGVYGVDPVPVATVPAGINTVSITVPSGTYFWVVTAFDNQGNESGFSNEETAKIVPGKPIRLRKK